jgi:hypothetical protein
MRENIIIIGKNVSEDRVRVFFENYQENHWPLVKIKTKDGKAIIAQVASTPRYNRTCQMI